MKTIEQLAQIRAEITAQMAPRFAEDSAQGVDHHIMVCAGTGCTSSKSLEIIERFRAELEAQGAAEHNRVVRTGCFGLCALGPVVLVYPEGIFYSRVTPDDAAEIVSEHILNGRLVERLLHREADTGAITHKLEDMEFYQPQMRIALRNCGKIDPENIDEYLAVDGYKALTRILTEKTPAQEIIDTVKASGLRGRGGAGFSAGQKWQFTANAASEDGVKFVCCNADEGDPGAFMDRSILEGDPHSVLEAMIIAGYAVGAHQGYIRVTSTSGPSTPSRCTAWMWLSVRPRSTACWGRISWAAAFPLIWSCAWARAPSSAVRRPP